MISVDYHAFPRVIIYMTEPLSGIYLTWYRTLRVHVNTFETINCEWRRIFV